MEILSVPWPYWVMAIVAWIVSALVIRWSRKSAFLADCPFCGEPLDGKGEVCQTCSERVKREMVFLSMSDLEEPVATIDAEDRPSF
jgi:hypothetical protein